MNCNYKVKMKDIQNKYKFKIFCAGYEYDDTELRNEISQRALISEAGRYVELELNSNTYVLTAKLKDKNNNVISSSTPIDLPLESTIVNATYDSTTKSLIITLQNGNTTTIPLGDLIDGLATEEDLNEVRDNLEVVQNELNQYKTIYNVLPKVEDEGEALTLNDTGNATLKIDLKGNTTQNGTPTPNAPIPVNVVSGDNEIVVCGKNLFDKNSITLGYIDSNGNVVSAGVTNVSTSDFILIPSGATNLVRTTLKNSAFYDEDKVFISRIYSTSLPVPNNAKYIRLTVNNTDLNNEQLEVGSTATTYEPYQDQRSYPINLGNIELCKIGDYQDRIYKDSGKWYLHKEIGKLVLDGTQTLTYELALGVDMFKYTNDDMLRGNILDGYCNYYENQKNIGPEIYQDAEFRFGWSSKIMYFMNDTSRFNGSLQNFNNWLTSHNVITYYPLATPTTTEITDTTLISQLNALASARSYTGQTNISQINNDAPFIISASALYDLNNLVTRVAILETE